LKYEIGAYKLVNPLCKLARQYGIRSLNGAEENAKSLIEKFEQDLWGII
jgi:hypothetical protein